MLSKQEALKLAIDGKKVRAVAWKPERYLVFRDNRFQLYADRTMIINPDLCHERWELYSEPPTYVDFPTAMKAFIEGKDVESELSVYTQGIFCIDGCFFTADEIKSKKWVVHDC